MKRFFCEICKKVKHVRRMPDNVVQNLNAKAPVALIGACRFHTETNRDKTNSRERVFDHFGSTRKISASSQKTKSKKG